MTALHIVVCTWLIPPLSLIIGSIMLADSCAAFNLFVGEGKIAADASASNSIKSTYSAQYMH